MPRIGQDGPLWGACDPNDPRNRRRRCALLIERGGADGVTTVLVDAGADLREQLIDAGAGLLDAVVLTHDHADHCHGLDDLRMVVFNRGSRLPTWMDAETEQTIFRRFTYFFETPEGSAYPPILETRRIEGDITVEGAGGTVTLHPFRVPHGQTTALGFRIGPVAYIPDISDMTASAWEAVSGLECWILDALRYRPHPSHANVETALGWIERAAPRHAVLTNLHTDIDYATLAAELPPGIEPARDGLMLEYEA